MPEENLVLRAMRLWPKNFAMQEEWLRAIEVVRSTRKGWLLDQHTIPTPRITLVKRERTA